MPEDKAFEKSLEELEETAVGIRLGHATPNPEAGKVKRQRRKREATMSPADRQKKYRKEMKRNGYKEVTIWVRDGEPKESKLDYKLVKTWLHKSNIDVCKSNPDIRRFLARVLDLVRKIETDGKYPDAPTLHMDIQKFFKHLGLK